LYNEEAKNVELIICIKSQLIILLLFAFFYPEIRNLCAVIKRSLLTKLFLIGMKKIFSFIIFSFLLLPLMAAQSISGKIVDATTQSPLGFVNVAIYKQNSKVPVTGITTDAGGNFTIPSVASGKYILRVSYVGYNPLGLPLNLSEAPLNLGVLKLVENNKILAEVEVIGQGSQMKFDIDKKVFTVDQNIAAAGGSATEVLQNIPSVDVDNEGNVSLRNNANVEVWINGKPSGLTVDNRAQVLQQMPAESIESIEIMTNPSAKFNPEGTAGIINLVLKKNRKAGYYGSVSTGLMIPDGGKLGGSLGASLNYSSSKIDAYANVGYRGMGMQGNGWNERTNYNVADTTLLRQDNTSDRAFHGLFMRAGVDFHLNDKNTLSLSGFGMNGGGTSTTKINYMLTDLSNDSVMQNYNRTNTETGDRPGYNLNLDYRHDFDKKDTYLTTSLSYSGSTRGGDSRYIQNDNLSAYKSDITQTADNTNKELQFKLDYTNKLSENSKLEAGWQSNKQNRLSEATAYDNLHAVDLPAYLNDFDYNEQIHAAYLTFGNRFNKLSVQAGLRAEYMWKQSEYTSSISTQKLKPQTYFELFPSMYLAYTLPKNNELQLNYTRRVNRPRGRQINPFRDFSDSTNISYGNSELSPEFSSSMELNYLKNWDNHSMSASAYYRFTDNVIENVRFMNAGVMESTYMNVAKSQNTGLELVAKNRLFTILNLTSSVNLYYSKMDSSVYVNPYNTLLSTTIPGQDSFSWSARIMANLMFSKTFSGQISGGYEAPELIAQGKENASYSIDMGLRKTFYDRKLSLNLMVRDLLNSRSHSSTTWGDGFYQRSESSFHGRLVGVTVSYNFGNMKPKQKEKKTEEAAPDMNMEGME